MTQCRRRAVIMAVVGCVSPSVRALDSPRRFSPHRSVETWRIFLASRGLRTETLTPNPLVQSSLDFFSSVDADGLTVEPQSDMLLYQWGVFNFGKGEFFEFDLTRQFLSAGRSGDDAISQFRCTAYFAPTPALRALKPGNRWCSSRKELPAFKQFILASPAFAAVKDVAPLQVVAEWSRV